MRAPQREMTCAKSLRALHTQAVELAAAKVSPPVVINNYAKQPDPLTTQLCLRYKYQVPKQGGGAQQQQQQHGSQKQVPLPPPPQQGIVVELFDGDGKFRTSLPLNASEGEFLMECVFSL